MDNKLDFLSKITTDDVFDLLKEKHGKLVTEEVLKDLEILTSQFSTLLFYMEMERNNISHKLYKINWEG